MLNWPMRFRLNYFFDEYYLAKLFFGLKALIHAWERRRLADQVYVIFVFTFSNVMVFIKPKRTSYPGNGLSQQRFTTSGRSMQEKTTRRRQPNVSIHFRMFNVQQQFAQFLQNPIDSANIFEFQRRPLQIHFTFVFFWLLLCRVAAAAIVVATAGGGGGGGGRRDATATISCCAQSICLRLGSWHRSLSIVLMVCVCRLITNFTLLLRRSIIVGRRRSHFVSLCAAGRRWLYNALQYWRWWRWNFFQRYRTICK